MPIKSNFPFSTTFANASTIYLQANGIERTNAQNPSGLGDSLIILDGVLASTMNVTDVITYGSQRADISWQSDTRAEHWYTWNIMIPSSWGQYEKRIVVAQIHDRPDGGDGSQYPNFLLMVDNKEFTISVPSAIHPTPINAGVSNGGYPLSFDRWYECCLHANWQTSGGFREFFIDRNPIFREYSLPTEYDNVQGPYLKIGLYNNYGWTDFGTKTAYFSNVKVWTGNDGYQTVMGGVPIAPRRTTAF